MLLAALAIVTQPLAAEPGDRPIRVRLEPAGVVAPGEPMRAYVDLARGGHLAALRVSATGRIEVLFPQDPNEGTYLAAGTYELRGARDRASFVAEPEGTGLVLVALAPLPYRFDEFARGADWDAAALAASWSGADAVGALLDVVQRMQGDGFFNYDFLRYTVAARTAFARGAANGVYCYGYGCGFGGIVIAHPFIPRTFCHPRHRGCDGSFAVCTAKFGRFDRDCAAWCRAGFGCVEPERDRVVALDPRDPARRGGAPPRPAEPGRPAAPRVIEPRSRLPAVSRPAAAPLARGTYVRPAPRPTAGALARLPASAGRELPVRAKPRAREPAAQAPVSVGGARVAPLQPGRGGARAVTRPVRVAWPRGAATARPATGVIPSEAKTGTSVGTSPRPPRGAKPGRAATWPAAYPPRAAGTKGVSRGKQ